VIWRAYCMECRAEVEACENGPLAEAGGRRHMKDNPGHHVLLGYWVCTHLHQSITGLTNGGMRSTCLGCGHYEDTPPKDGDRVFGWPPPDPSCIDPTD